MKALICLIRGHRWSRIDDLGFYRQSCLRCEIVLIEVHRTGRRRLGTSRAAGGDWRMPRG